MNTALVTFFIHWVYNLNVTQASHREWMGITQEEGDLNTPESRNAQHCSVDPGNFKATNAGSEGGVEKGLVLWKKRKQDSELIYFVHMHIKKKGK